MAAFRVKLVASDLNCVDVPLNPTHPLTQVNLILFVSLCLLQNCMRWFTCYVLSRIACNLYIVFTDVIFCGLWSDCCAINVIDCR